MLGRCEKEKRQDVYKRCGRNGLMVRLRASRSGRHGYVKFSTGSVESAARTVSDVYKVAVLREYAPCEAHQEAASNFELSRF